MQPRRSIGIGLAPLVRLLVCASVILPADASFGCSGYPANGQCPATPGFTGGQLKCQRCKATLKSFMDSETLNAETENVDSCESMVNSGYDGQNPNYQDSSTQPIEKCFTPGILLYDGAVECGGRGATAAGAISACIGAKTRFYDCLCYHFFNNRHVSSLTPCFQQGSPPDMRDHCPPNQSRPPVRIAPQRPNSGPRPKPGRKGSPGFRRSTSDDGSDDGSDDSGDDLEDDWPPDLSQQFSPVLEDVDVSFYIDTWERVVLVNTTTLEVIYYDPYYLYSAPSFDQIFPVQDEDNLKLVRRCWFYPFSNRVWCYQWYITPDEYAEYGYADNNTTSSANITASAGDTTVPATYTSVSYTTAGPIPTTKKSDASSPTGTESSVSASTPTKGASTAASQYASNTWLLSLPLLALMHYAL